jgi:hypothetical protein
MYEKVYTSGVIVNDDSEEGVTVAQDLYVSITNFGDRPVFVKVEVFNWGDADTSATPPGTPTTPLAVMVTPAEEFQIPAGTTQHFYANLFPNLETAVKSFEVRVTIQHRKHPQSQVVFNAVSVDRDGDFLENQVLFKEFVLLKDDIDDKKKRCNGTSHPDKDWY